MDVFPDDRWDAVIENDGTLEELYAKLDELACSARRVDLNN